MTAQFPLVIAGLTTLLPTLTGWDKVLVTDGPAPTENRPQQWATVGYVDQETAGAYSNAPSADGFRWMETGQIINQLSCSAGGSDLPGIRAEAVALMNQLDSSIRTDRTLGGVLSKDGGATLAVEVRYLTNSRGVACVLIFTVSYTTYTV